MTVRERTQQIERQTLAPYASLSQQTRGRQRPEEECALRTCYQRDRDRIIHCKAFRRLKQKTQVFLAPEGDHYRTRLTHTLEVTQIARTVARALRVNEDLTEAVALGHDLGHTPFGHAGERALREICPYGFEHNEQSVRVVERLEKEGKGLNLTWEVRDGIRCHTSGAEAQTVEGRIVRIADRIAYINPDIDDAQRAGVLQPEQIPEEATRLLGSRRSTRIHTLVSSLVENSREGNLQMAPEIQRVFQGLHEFMYQTVYRSPFATQEEKKVPGLIERLYAYFLGHPEKMPQEMQRIAEEEDLPRAVCDYIAGMTDHYAIGLFEEIFVPKAWRS